MRQTTRLPRIAHGLCSSAAGNVGGSLGPWRDSPLTSSHSLPLDLQPGDHRTVSLGGDGATVTGQVVATGRDNARLDKNWSLNYLISRDRGIDLPSEIAGPRAGSSGPIESSWFLNPESGPWLNTREHYFVKLAPDGRFRICGVPAGTYDLVLRLYEQPADCLVETVGEKVVTVEVDRGEIQSGSKDVGRIEVECRSGPRVGEYMGSYEFADTTGRVRSIHDVKGRFVLMHVWASWCEPCLASMPGIRAAVFRLESRPVTFVGLNVDSDASKARELAANRGWTWSQNYLGDASDMARQLAISSIPTYYLIDRDGKLLASAVDWPAIEKQLESALAEGPD